VETTFIITFIGDDRPGMVEELSSVISSQGGNWLESRLSQLAGKFAGLIQVRLPLENAEPLQLALKELNARGLSVRVTAIGEGTQPRDHQRNIRLEILGPDRPGIVREIARALSEKDINVVDMHSEVSSAPMSAESLFNASVEAQLPEQVDLEELGDTLATIGNTMDVDITLLPEFEPARSLGPT
jgi:glycine cleavage system regulatory protein